MGVPLRQAQYRPLFEYHSTSRWGILMRAFMCGAAFVGCLFLLMRLGIGGPGPGLLMLFLAIATVALFLLALRRKRTVFLDQTNLIVRRGAKRVVIPWRVFAWDPNQLNQQLKLENLMGWRRLKIKVEVYGKKVSVGLDQIFGVGLPVDEIAARSWQLIHTSGGG